MTDKHYRIVELRLENLKRIKAVTIRPDRSLVEITGRNGAGKTSILDSIWWAIKGGRNIQAQPIRRGCEKALIRLDMGELIVTRTFASDDAGGFTTKLKVERGDGSRFDKPQEILDALAGELSFDPLAFSRMAPRDQFDALRAFVPGVDFEAIDAENKRDFERRTDVNRETKRLQAQADAIKLPEGPAPKPVDIDALEQRLATASDHNTDIARRQGARQAGEDRITAIQTEITRLTEEMHDLQRKLAAAPGLPAPIDVEDVRQKLAEGRRTNEAARSHLERNRLIDLARASEAEADKLTKAMEERNKARADAVQAASMPIEGLAFGDGFVVLNGAPFSQASDAEQLRASIAIAGALNPMLRVVRVRDGSLIDRAGMEQLSAYAEANDLQIWLEAVESPRAAAILIEDGDLASAASAEVEVL